MNADDRKEFFYEPIRMIFPGVLILLIGAFLVLLMLGYLLGLNHVHVEGTETEKLYLPYVTLSVGFVIAFFGLRFLSKGLDGRPAVVVDSAGLFYRPHGGIIPWADIRLVESDFQGENNYIFVYRRSGPPVIIYMRPLPGFGREGPVYTAIMQAWQSYRHPEG